jgi:hypothetical protein
MATKPRAHPNEPTPEDEGLPKGFASYADEVEFRRARYSHIEHEMDALGRMIGVRRLKLSERTRLTAMTPDLSGMDEIQRADGTVMLAPQRAQYFIVAMVCQINDAMFTFPRNRGELDAVLDRLDQEGLDAAAIAVNRILADDEIGDQAEKAKNLSGIPGSE